jgi:hypothetical protein
MDDVQNILQFAQIAQQSGPEGQLILKMDALLDLIGDKMAIPQSIRNSLEEREMLKQELAEQAQMMAQENPELAQEVATQAVKGGM